ncbi:terminase TerL endonuclease subunit, partial [Escherichia sp. TWPC-MK]
GSNYFVMCYYIQYIPIKKRLKYTCSRKSFVGPDKVAIPCRISTLSGPTKDFREQVYQKKMIHNNNPVLNWAIGNAVTKQDANENIMLDKSKATERIDPIAAVINSHVRCMLGSGEVDLNSYILSQNFSF